MQLYTRPYVLRFTCLKKTLHKRNGESYIILLRNLGLIGLTAMSGVPCQVGRPAYDG